MDAHIQRILALSEASREFCCEFVASHARLATGQEVNELFFVPMMLVYRAIRQQDAILLLLRHSFPAEASVVALTQFELCLDVLYIRDNVSRATEWMNHSSVGRSPWKVAKKINDIWASDPNICATKHGYFNVLSAIKHGNPTAGGFGFPARVVNDRFTMTTGEVDDSLSRTHTMLVASASTYHLIECLEGASRAFATFVVINRDLDNRRQDLLESWRVEANRIATVVGLAQPEPFH